MGIRTGVKEGRRVEGREANPPLQKSGYGPEAYVFVEFVDCRHSSSEL